MIEMKDKNLINEYKEKIKYLKKLNKFYYDKSKPLVSDHEYDNLKKEIGTLETKYNYLIKETSALNNVGYKPLLRPVKDTHNILLLYPIW